MNIKKHIPNLFTLSNLFCGTFAIIFAVNSKFELTAIFVAFGIFFDFFDGFLARILKVSGELGKQLDSLADMVTSGVVPGIVMFYLLANKQIGIIDFKDNFFNSSYIPLFGFLITLGACYRLAKFNLDTRQTESFIGLPTPAAAIYIASLPIIGANYGTNFSFELLIISTIILSLLLVAELPLFSLKISKRENMKSQLNIIRILFLISSVILLFVLQFASIPFIVILYIFLSIINNLIK